MSSSGKRQLMIIGFGLITAVGQRKDKEGWSWQLRAASAAVALLLYWIHRLPWRVRKVRNVLAKQRWLRRMRVRIPEMANDFLWQNFLLNALMQET